MSCGCNRDPNGLSDLGLAQIYPLWDEDTSDERTAVSASFADPYLAIIRDDSSLLLLQADVSGDIDEVDVSEDIAAHKWLSCCLYRDRTGIFSTGPHAEKPTQEDLCLFLLSSDCKLFVSWQFVLLGCFAFDTYEHFRYLTFLVRNWRP